MKTTRKHPYIVVLLTTMALILGLASCDRGNDTDVLFTGDDYENMMQYIDGDRSFSSFASIVRVAGMVDVLSSYNHHIGGDGYTLFLPDNQAVETFIASSDRYSSLEALLSDSTYSTEIVRYHLVNAEMLSTEFPNGVLSDKTISNFSLTVLFTQESDATISYAVNGESKVIEPDVYKSNGIIHVVDKMLTPIVFTSYEWVAENTGYSIFSELLEKTGLEDTLNLFEYDDLGREVYNEYTMFAESDALYAANGITSFQDLVNVIAPSGTDYSNRLNAVNQYARYHILEKSIFLDEVEADAEKQGVVYNTYGDLPVSVALDFTLKFNAGTEVYDTLFQTGDTTIVDYLMVDLDNSNIVTRTGAIHQLDQLLFPFSPRLQQVTYIFDEEPEIMLLIESKESDLIQVDDLDYISLIGTNVLAYVYSATELEGCAANDYVKFSGDVDFTYQTPRILAGTYRMQIQIQRGYSTLATIQASVDGEKVGVAVDPRTEKVKFANYTIGTVEFTGFESHTIKLSTVIPGRVSLDRIIFSPIL